MRIALFHNAPSGGAKRAIYEWTKRLATTHEIDVYTLSTADHEFCDIRPYVREHRVFDFTPHRLLRPPLGRFNQLQRWRDLHELTSIGQKIAYEIDTKGYHIVFVHTCMYTFMPTLLQFVQSPVIFYLHEPFGRMFVRHIERPYFRTGGWRTQLDSFDPLIRLYSSRLTGIQQQGVNKSRRLLANSHFTKAIMQQEFHGDFEVCHYGVDIEKYHVLTTKCKENIVLSVGELTPRKGFDFLVESLAHIPNEERPVLRLVCNRVNVQEQTFIQDLAQRRQVQIDILNDLNADQLRTEYNRAKMCVFAPYQEPFGLVPLEAMACGTPVVGVREGGVPETVIHEQTGLLVERDLKRFAEAVQRLLSDSALASRLGQQGRQQVMRQWTWDRSVAQIEEQLLTYRRSITS